MNTNNNHASAMKFSGLAILTCWLFLLSCSPCDQEKGQEVISPNKALTASVVHIGCGAIAKDATWVTLHETGDKYDRSDDIVFTAVQRQSLEVAWTDDQHLTISCGCRNDEIRFQVVKKSGIDIVYR